MRSWKFFAAVCLSVLCFACGPQYREGPAGKDGTNGINGVDGYSMVFTTVTAAASQCPTGGSVFLVAQDTNRNGTYDIADGSQQSAVVCNGDKGDKGDKGDTGDKGDKGDTGNTGPQGPAGTSALSVVYPIQPCGSQSSPWKEVLLCLYDGNVLASFSKTASGQNTRLSFIPAGSYIDTDESGCAFSVSQSGGSTTVNWNSGSNGYGSWSAGSYTCVAH